MFVKLLVDLNCSWTGIPPTYRLYVNDEMLAERDYKWSDPVYIIEVIQIEIPVMDITTVELKKIGPQIGNFKFINPRIKYCDQHVRFFPISDTQFNIQILDTINPKKEQVGNR